MEWGIVMSVFTVVGMLVLIFATPETKSYQTFGRIEVNPPKRPARAVHARPYKKTGLKVAA
jgi:hypothetical protein